jgi:hypothetical protein
MRLKASSLFSIRIPGIKPKTSSVVQDYIEQRFGRKTEPGVVQAAE